MIDGVKIFTRLPDFRSWEAEIGIPFTSQVFLSSGTLEHCSIGRRTTYTHRAEWCGYRLTVKEIVPADFGAMPTYNLTVKGSLHKAYHGNNWEPFTYAQLCDEIFTLANVLHMLPSQFTIQNLEVGINIPLGEAPANFIRNSLIAYKGKAFTAYKPDRAGRILGGRAGLRQYELKGYDKGMQYNLPSHLMRLELRYSKMAPLNELGTLTLAHLLRQPVLAYLGNKLLTAWQQVLVYDIAEDPQSLPLRQSQRRLLIEGRHPTYWTRLTANEPHKVQDRRQAFRRLVETYGRQSHEQIKQGIVSTWQELLGASLNPHSNSLIASEVAPIKAFR